MEKSKSLSYSQTMSPRRPEGKPVRISSVRQLITEVNAITI